MNPFSQTRKPPRRYKFGFKNESYLSFQPEGLLTREQAAKLLALCSDTPGTLSYPPHMFSDSEERWSSVFVGSLWSQGLIAGYPDGTFGPEKEITRAELVTLIMRVLGIRSEGASGFQDANGHWAEGYLSAALKKGFLTGYPDNTLKPDAPVTRAEAAKLLFMAFWTE